MAATIHACDAGDATNIHHHTSLRLCEAAANRKKAYVTSSPLPQGDHPPQTTPTSLYSYVHARRHCVRSFLPSPFGYAVSLIYSDLT